ncbi:MAG: NAD(P)/FAD-dependent oxidoreductase [Candidatus Sericytochromatia bacterium]|nr:NAD(P)/FAD-dependent oxidoreductase [Candidatus Sericytochromatia bacterium]
MTTDCIIVGGGHNGLIAAGYLARAGRKVTVLERREVVGGCCVTEERYPGFKMSVTSYVVSLLLPQVVRDLELKKYGYDFIVRDPSSLAAFPDGRTLRFFADGEKTRAEIARFSQKDAEAWGPYHAQLERLAQFAERILTAVPPDISVKNPFSLVSSLPLALHAWHLSAADRAKQIELLSSSAADYLDRFFESEQLKAVLATDGIIGAFAGPRTPGTAYVLLHHVMGGVDGRRGVWGYVRGGMGGLTQALARSAEAHGATIRTSSPVKRILVQNGRAIGVELESGETIKARQVLSNADPNRTFLQMVGRDQLPGEFADAVAAIRYRSASFKVNLALSGLPTFTHLPAGANPREWLTGTIHFSQSIDQMERAFDQAKYGHPSERPVVEACIPSLLDDSIAPPGQHFMSMFCQYAPYQLAEGKWDQARKDAFVESVIRVAEEFAPDIRSKILHIHALSPADLETEFGLTGGSLFHGDMTTDQLFSMRPVAGWSGYTTPIEGLLLCGSGAHPGGGVMGACGYNAARVALKQT